MAATRCAICGAPLTGSVCSYCGTPVQNSRKTAGNNPYGNTAYNRGTGSERGMGETRFDQRTRRTEPAAASCRRAVSTRNKWVALVLCLTVGWLGIHRFYVGKIGTGILFWVTKGFYGVGVLIDLILILTDRFEDAEGRPLVGESENGKAEA